MAGTSNSIDQNTNQFLKLSGGTMSGAIAMGTNRITGVGEPSAAQDAATKNYVDTTALNGTSVYAATISNLSATQAGAGVGATLTDNSGTFAAFTVDGATPPLNSNILVKDYATAQNEGIYTLTRNGDGISIPWQLTRATGYDTATEINNTGLIVIQNGTQAGQAWYNAATIVTVDTTPFSYSRFGGTSNITQVKSQIFTSNGTYTPSTGMTYCIVEAVGGGGGGGGALANAGNASAGGGGGGGGYARSVLTLAQIQGGGTVAQITIGSAGTGGTAAPTAGNNGGNTVVTANNGAGSILVQANGGNGGGAGTDLNTPTVLGGGFGGSGATGDVKARGQAGTNGFTFATNTLALGGAGGDSMYGGGGRGTGGTTNSVGLDGEGYGAGGSGAFVANNNSKAGGNGTAGIVIITEFCAV